jgi:carbon monoxide dehydrogenase subunit G
MTTVERTTTILVTPHDVWAVLADFGSINGWAPNVDHSCLLSDQDSGIGTKRRIQTGRTTIVETVIAWDPGVMLSYAITGLPPVIRSVTNTWRLEPAGGGTKVTLTSEIDAGPRPPQKLIAKAVARKLGAASDQMLNGIAAHLDPKVDR